MKAHKIEAYIDQYLLSNSVKIDGVELISLIVTRLYLKLFTKRKQEPFYKILFKRLLVLLNSFNKNKIISKQNYQAAKPQFLFIISYAINDLRNTSILINMVKKLDHEDSLILTDQDDVYNWCNENQYKSQLIKARKWVFHKKTRKIKASFTDKVLLSRGIYLFKNALLLLEELSPKIVLTVQDFHLNDQLYTLAAQKLGVKTITHQHGLLSVDENPFLFKYTISDRVMVWGQGSFNIFSKWLDPSKLVIMGTDKFNEYANINKAKRELITIGINPIPEKQNIELLQSIVLQIKSIEKLINEKGLKIILKLHPQLKQETWKAQFSNMISKQNLKVEFEVLKNNNKEILEYSVVLITHKSSISLEGFLAQTGVIELALDDSATPLFKSIPNSIIPLKQLGEELNLRIVNFEYNQTIIEQQNKFINFEIDNHNASENEIIYLNKLRQNSFIN